MEKLLFAVIMPPAAAFIELDKMCKPPLGKGAPFLGDLVERMGGKPCRHEGAGSQRALRCEIVWFKARISNDWARTGWLTSKAHKPNRSNIIIFPRGAQEIRLRAVNKAQHP
jgi:hypothetical protein